MAKQENLLKWLNLLGLILVLLINSLANILKINGQTTGDISANYPTLFTPAGYAFSIWSLIYLGLIGFVVFLFTKPSAPSRSAILTNVGWLFIVNCLANALWLFAWHYERFWLTMIFMLLLLTTLILINDRLDKIPSWLRSSSVRWFVRFPFSVYLGWICVATVANVSVLLVSQNWDAFGMTDEFWAITTVIVAGAIAVFLALYSNRYAGALTIIWGLYAIRVKLLAQDSNIILQQVLLVTCGLILIATLVAGYLEWKRARITKAEAD